MVASATPRGREEAETMQPHRPRPPSCPAGRGRDLYGPLSLILGITPAMRIADRWFDRRRIDDDITLLWEPHVDPLLRCNIWHVRGRDRPGGFPRPSDVVTTG